GTRPAPHLGRKWAARTRTAARIAADEMELGFRRRVIRRSAASEYQMNKHVPRPDRSEHSLFGLKLTDAQPLSGIPAIWRLGAMISTLAMGALALIAALYFGRPVLLPVVAALIIGITLSPAVEFGTRFNIPASVSA